MSYKDSKKELTFFVIVVAIIASFGGLLFGFDIGGSGGTFVMEGFREQMGWPTQACPAVYEQANRCSYYEDEVRDVGDVKVQKALISAIFSLSAMVGALGAGTLADLFGRKLAIMANSLIFTVGCACQASAPKVWLLLIGRGVSGYAIGQLSTIVPMYQSEIAPAHIRGLLVSFQQLSITFGILAAAAINVGLKEFEWGWRLSYGGNGIISVIMFFAMFILPESPRFLVMKDRNDDAAIVMEKIRAEDATAELNTIVEDVSREKEMGSGSWAEVFSNDGNMLYRTFLGCFLQFLQQLSGINAIMFFGPSMFGTFFNDTAALLGNLAIQAGNFLSTFICLYLIDRTGRVVLLVVGGVGMLIGTAAMAFLSSPVFDYKESKTIGYLIIFFTVVYVVNFAYSWGPVVWVVCSEFYPNRLRGKAMSLSTATNWTFAALVGFVTPYMYASNAFDLYGTFIFFCFWIVVLTIAAYTLCPETGGLSLEEIDQLFDDFKPCSKRKLHFTLQSKDRADAGNNSNSHLHSSEKAI